MKKAAKQEIQIEARSGYSTLHPVVKLTVPKCIHESRPLIQYYIIGERQHIRSFRFYGQPGVVEACNKDSGDMKGTKHIILGHTHNMYILGSS